ncbi:MAG: hypothetical protein RBS56_01140 [Candidatus Gracilibacteria bacterium]|jgi:FixJ family two-component response regulator|nr:hypothetical protein [Candidatus Gracilibacteria bacterium]
MNKQIEIQGGNNSFDLGNYLGQYLEEATHVREVCERISEALKTDRQREVFSGLIDGKNHTEIAEELGVTDSRIGQIVFQIQMTAISVLEELEGRDFSHLAERKRTPAQHKAFLRRNGIE